MPVSTFEVRLLHPKLDQTTGAVSVKVESWDVAGNGVTPTIDRAYGLR